MILSAIGIIFMVDNHCNEPLGFLTSLFPYNSFFMPMFVFISGYFFKPERAKKLPWYVFDKAKKLLKPYYLHNVVLGGTLTFLASFIGISWIGDFSFYNLFYVAFSWGTIFDITSASWFIIMLFSVVIFYGFINSIYGRYTFTKDTFYLVFLIIIGAIAVHLSMRGYSKDIRYILVLKVAFYIQFYHLGVWFKRYLATSFQSTPPLLVCGICVGLSIVVHLFYVNEQLVFNSTAFMQSFTCQFVLLPFITSVIGILFFLSLSQFLIPILGDNLLINEISNNTLTILTTHLIFFNLINLFFFFFYNFGFFQDFNVELFQKSAWYSYNAKPVYKWFYLIAGIFGPLLLQRSYIGKLLKI